MSRKGSLKQHKENTPKSGNNKVHDSGENNGTWVKTNTLIAAFAAIISVIGLVLSWRAIQIANAEKRLSEEAIQLAKTAIYVSEKSLKESREANKISRNAQTPDIKVEFFKQVSAIVEEPPCIGNDNQVEWHYEFAPIFDFKNIGGRATSLDKIITDQINIQYRNLPIKIVLTPFGSKNAYEEWKKRTRSIEFNANNPRQNPILDSSYSYLENQNLEYVGTPLLLTPGPSTRIVMFVGISGTIENDNTISEAIDVLASQQWYSDVEFEFSNNIRIDYMLKIDWPDWLSDYRDRSVQQCKTN